MADGGGLYLLVKINGARHWRLKYRFLGKEKLLAIGPYPPCIACRGAGGHGFRSLGMSTIKEKLGYRHEVVDRQLAHAHKSKIDRAYDDCLVCLAKRTLAHRAANL